MDTCKKNQTLPGGFAGTPAWTGAGKREYFTVEPWRKECRMKQTDRVLSQATAPKSAALLALVVLAFCLAAGSWSARAAASGDEVKGNYPETVNTRADVPLNPAISERDVRKWFKTVRFKGYKQVSLYHEFHPVEGNLLALYQGKSKEQMFLSYVDNNRKDPVYGFKRGAKEIISNGVSAPVRQRTINDRVWYGREGDEPIIAVDVTPEVKLVLMGFAELSLEDLFSLAESLDIESLAKAAKSS